MKLAALVACTAGASAAAADAAAANAQQVMQQLQVGTPAYATRRLLAAPSGATLRSGCAEVDAILRRTRLPADQDMAGLGPFARFPPPRPPRSCNWATIRTPTQMVRYIRQPEPHVKFLRIAPDGPFRLTPAGMPFAPGTLNFFDGQGSVFGNLRVTSSAAPPSFNDTAHRTTVVAYNFTMVLRPDTLTQSLGFFFNSVVSTICQVRLQPVQSPDCFDAALSCCTACK
jgi:hypothetical protein